MPNAAAGAASVAVTRPASFALRDRSHCHLVCTFVVSVTMKSSDGESAVPTAGAIAALKPYFKRDHFAEDRPVPSKGSVATNTATPNYSDDVLVERTRAINSNRSAGVNRLARATCQLRCFNPLCAYKIRFFSQLRSHTLLGAVAAEIV